MMEYFERPEVSELIAQYAASHQLDYDSLDDDQLMSILEELQILDPLLEEMGGKASPEESYQNRLEEFEVSNSFKNLKIWIERGRKFREWKDNPKGDKFFISIAGLGNKLKTNSQPIAESFSIGESSVFSVDGSELKTSNSRMLELSVVVMTREGTRRVYAIKQVEWRYVMAHGSVSFDIELAPYDNEGVGKVTAVGIVSLKLQLYPVSKLTLVQPKAIDRQIELELK